MNTEQARSLARSLARLPHVHGAAVYDVTTSDAAPRRALAWRGIRALGTRRHAADVATALALLEAVTAGRPGDPADTSPDTLTERTPHPLEIVTIGHLESHLIRCVVCVSGAVVAVHVVFRGGRPDADALTARLDALLGATAGHRPEDPPTDRTNPVAEQRPPARPALPRRDGSGARWFAARPPADPAAPERDPDVLQRILGALRDGPQEPGGSRPTTEGRT